MIRYLAVLVVFAISTVVFNFRTLKDLGAPRACPPQVMREHWQALHGNDTPEFLRLLEESANSLQHGRVYFPISDYDCPVTFLVPAGLVRLATGWEPIVILNLFFIISFFLSGLTAFWFFRTIGGQPYLSLLFAVFYQSANFAFFAHHMGHMNSAQIQWIPLIFVAVVRMLTDARARWVVLLGAGMGLQVLSSPSYTVYLFCAALPIFVLTYLVSRHRQSAEPLDYKRLALRFSLAAGLALLISGFYLVQRMGSMPHIYPPPTWLPFAFHDIRQLIDPTHSFLFIGLPLFVLLILSVHWWKSDREPMTTAIAFTLFAALIMMLPAVPGTPYWVLYKLNPLFHYLRVPTRFFPIFFLMLLALATLYLTKRSQFHSKAHLRWIAAVLLLSQTVFCWFSSPWIMPVDAVGIAKQLLGKSQGPASVR